MAKKIHHLEGFTIENEFTEIRLDLGRIENNVNAAQYWLDSMVMTSMVPFMPMDTGHFINVTKAMSAAIAGTGKVAAAAPPQGRFLYEGKTMVDMGTGSPWARKGAKKVLVSEFGGKTEAKQNLNFSKSAHPSAQSHWFDAAKKKDCEKWVRDVKKIAGGGK